MDSFIFCQEKPFGELFSKNSTRTAQRVFDFEKSNEIRIAVFALRPPLNSAENLCIFKSLSEKDDLMYLSHLLHVCLVSQVQQKSIKILPRSAISLRIRSARRLLDFTF